MTQQLVEHHKRLKRIAIDRAKIDLIPNIMSDTFEEHEFKFEELHAVAQVFVENKEHIRIYETNLHTFIGKFVDRFGELERGWIGELGDLKEISWLRNS